MKLIIYTDGGARNNPGPAAGGIIFRDERGIVIKKFSKFFGEKTNNQAEYLAVIEALEKASETKADELQFYLDSKLVTEQINKNYKIKNKELQRLFIKVLNLTLKFKRVIFHFIPREKNKEADKLVNECLDEYS